MRNFLEKAVIICRKAALFRRMRRLSTVITILLSSYVYGWSFGDVVINELMWMGTSRSPYDEYVELRNMTGHTINFAAEPWSLYRNDELVVLINRGILPAYGYFLISRLDTNESALAVAPDIVAPSLVLNNSDVQYRLFAGPDSTYPLIDVADDGVGAPLAGRYSGIGGGVYWSMERNDPPGDGTLAENWHDACLTINFDSGAVEHGTPKSANRENTPPNWGGVIPPALVQDGDDVTLTAVACEDSDGIPDSLEVIAVWYESGSGTPIYTARRYPIPAGGDADLVLPASFTQPEKTYRWQVSLNDGQDTVYAEGEFFVHFNRHDIVIDEVCWGGSSQSPDDEWIELANLRGDTVFFAQTPIFLWTNDLTGRYRLLARIDSGFVAPDGRFLITRLPAGDSRTALAVSPDMVLSSLRLYDGALKIAITDRADTNFLIDAAGDGSAPFAGAHITCDSLWATMFRTDPNGDGTIPDNWAESQVSINFLPGLLDRGTPKAPSVQNTAPEISPVDTIPLFAPDTGTRDTTFKFTILYRDADGDEPYFAHCLYDIDGDGNWEPDEIFPMAIISGADPEGGLVLQAEIAGAAPTTGNLFTFRISDSLVVAAFPVPADTGPVVYPTAAFEISDTVWRTDTLHWIYDRHTISPPFEIHNTGDAPMFFRMSIIQQDSVAYDGCFPWSSGGWLATCDESELICNKYRLSAIFLSAGEIPDSSWFNQFGAEDCVPVMPEFKYARKDTFGHDGTCPANGVQPGEGVVLWFMVDLPRYCYGTSAGAPHEIIVQLKGFVTFP